MQSNAVRKEVAPTFTEVLETFRRGDVDLNPLFWKRAIKMLRERYPTISEGIIKECIMTGLLWVAEFKANGIYFGERPFEEIIMHIRDA